MNFKEGIALEEIVSRQSRNCDCGNAGGIVEISIILMEWSGEAFSRVSESRVKSAWDFLKLVVDIVWGVVSGVSGVVTFLVCALVAIAGMVFAIGLLGYIVFGLATAFCMGVWELIFR